MALVVTSNIESLHVQRNLAKSTQGLATSMQRITSGMRINSAKDDAAGIQISGNLTSQINGLNLAQRNASDGISIAQTAEGALVESTAILQRMRELSLQAANGINNLEDRDALQQEMSSLQQELTLITESTHFGDMNLLDGSFGTRGFQVGANANETLNITLKDFSSDAIGAYQVNGEPRHTGVSNIGFLLAGEMGTDDPLTSDNWNINGTSVSLAAGDAAAVIADTLNNAVPGIGASAQLTTRIQNLTSADTGTLEFVKGYNGSSYDAVDSFDLADYAGDMEKLAADLTSNGYFAVYDPDLNGGAGAIELVAEDVDGINISNSATVELEKNGTSIPASGHVNGVHQGSELHLSSADKISVSGSAVNHYLALGAAGVAGNSGGTASLNAIENLDISGPDAAGAQSAVEVIDAALTQIDSSRATLGAIQNRFNHTIKNLANMAENTTESRGRIQDTDYAFETSQMTKQQILQQAGTSVLSQANQLPQAALSLL
ncbi:flagellin [Thalassomonas sp. RHCl1]|uniref:flagellin N-terminal helical domain-containing protein n=1 Tax=Thalassomonas sp. RHCl1 TaxID=2995320 RepID=UPI00248C9569|nr:flagellin [Thalassomonas sp. RHCl1]